MYRFRSYAILFVVTMLLQIFLFDNLSISIYFCPMIYPATLLLMPLDSKPVWLLAVGWLTGMLMDATMGTAGLNTIATLPVAFLRPGIVSFIYHREDAREGGLPSSSRFERSKFLEYLFLCLVLHHLIFFSCESLSWLHVGHTLLRIAISTAASFCFLWLTARIFTPKIQTLI